MCRCAGLPRSGRGEHLRSMPCVGTEIPAKLAEIRRSVRNIVCPPDFTCEVYLLNTGRASSRIRNCRRLFLKIEAGIGDAAITMVLPFPELSIELVVNQDLQPSRASDCTQTKVIKAAAIAHEKPVPYPHHTEQGMGALDQVPLFRDLGASLPNVVLSHTDGNRSCRSQEVSLAEVMLEYDYCNFDGLRTR